MITQVIKWLPNTSPNIVAYEVLFSDTGSAGQYSTLTTVAHIIPGPNWSNQGYFFFNDTLIPYRFYRLRTLDRYGHIAEDEAPTPFKAGNDPVQAPSLHTQALDANTGGPNALQYVSRGGSPIGNANVRVYRKIDWDLKKLANVIGTTITKGDGTWTNPVFAQPGDTYTIVFHKTFEFGPDTIEITI
jgi:hypothetical protein